MAKPKIALLIKVYPDTDVLHVFCENREQNAKEIANVEGVVRASVSSSGLIEVYTDPRYDAYELEEEIRLLLSSEVPDAFREE